MGGRIIPTMTYEDAPAMIRWLGEAFGFEPHLVVDDGDGGVRHAQLTLGPVMIMLGSARDDGFGVLQRTPMALGGTTQSAYIIVDDVDGLADRATAADAKIAYGPESPPHGGRSFGCIDPEGHLWNFGSYDPWAEVKGE
ncbi:MAG: glyoxalase [Alphaproteobacteria bacterium]|nr:glyoxalase [Alphaproteobacteria bacterium]